MSTDQDRDPIDQAVFLLRIIHVVMSLGILMFLVVAVLVMRHGEVFGKDPWSVTTPMTMIAVIFAAMAIVAHVVVPNLAVNAQRRALARGTKAGDAGPSDAEALMALFTNQVIIGTAIIEGAALLNTVVYFLEGAAVPLLLAVLLLGILLSRIPSRDAMTTWLGEQVLQLQEERQIG
jgi:hypothetical protein